MILHNDKMPITSKGFRSLGTTDYGTADQALAELVDNSWEIGYPTTFVNIVPHYSGRRSELKKIDVFEDGPGMDVETLERCLSIGSETDKTAGTLGFYGMGLKTSCLWCGDSFEILTKQAGGRLYHAVADIEGNRMIEEVESEATLGSFVLKTGTDHGTIITIHDIHKYNFPKKLGGFKRIISRGLGITFSFLIGGERKGNIMICGEKVEPIYFYNDKCKVISEEGATLSFTNVNGETVTYPYVAVHVPTDDDLKNDPMFLEKNMENQGVTYVRNGRVTGKGLLFGMVARNNIYNGCRIIVFGDGRADRDFGVSYNKSIKGKTVNENLKDSMVSEFKRHFEESKRLHNKSVTKGEVTEDLKRAVEKVNEELNNIPEIQDQLKDIKGMLQTQCGKAERTKQKQTEAKEPKEPKAITPEDEEKEKKPRRTKMKFNGVQFIFETVAMGEENCYFEPDFTEAGAPLIRINSEHNFYKNYLYGRSSVDAVNDFKPMVSDWFSLYGHEVEQTTENREIYNKYLLARSKSLASMYKEKQEE